MVRSSDTSDVKRLRREMSALIEEIERTTAVLKRYKTLSAQLLSRVENGQVLVEALHQLEGPMRRREVTDAMDQLDSARHRVRLAMFALGEAQGTSVSELGRKLGISRQLAARLAKEAAEGLR